MRIIALYCIALPSTALAQWETQASNTTVQLRGVSAVSARVAWASGEKGTVLRTVDGGTTWRIIAVPDADSLDFRDVQTVSERVAYVLSIGPGAASRIYKTTDSGAHWTRQFTNPDAGAFFDCLAFWDARHGIAVSDPVAGRFVAITTADGGATWTRIPPERMPPAIAGESEFAASGTCLTTQGRRNAWFTTGGSAARVIRTTDRGRTWSVATTPIAAGSSSSGSFTVAFRDARHGVILGGDYKRPDQAGDNVAQSADGGRTWTLAPGPRPAGYRSGSSYVPGARTPTLVAVGERGSDISRDDGAHWTPIDTVGFNAVSFAASNAGWAVGANGRIARWTGR